MKANRALVFVFVAILAFGFVACNDDDDVRHLFHLI
jgi:hypothetical protein